MIKEILDKLNESNSTNHKLKVLQDNKGNKLLVTLLAMTYDKVKFTYGITPNSIEYNPQAIYDSGLGQYTLEEGLELLKELLVVNKLRGLEASTAMKVLLECLSATDAEIILKVLGRDLKVGLGRTNINKVIPGLIVKPPYSRCSTYSDKTIKKIKFPAILQTKADGMYQAVSVEDGKVTFTSRSGEEREFPYLIEAFVGLPNGVYLGELLVFGVDDRATANGIINSDEPSNKIYMTLWDYLTHEEFYGECKTDYDTRLTTLIDILNTSSSLSIFLIETKTVGNLQEALQITSEWMVRGLEGAVLKDFSYRFKDHTSPHQLKLKVEMQVEVRCVSFTDGTKGTSREATFGAINFENDEGTIKGRTSGFTDAQLLDFNSRRAELMGQVMTVQFNDLTKGRDSDTYSLSHPRFIEFRNDKDTTDTLEEAFRIRDAAIKLEGK